MRYRLLRNPTTEEFLELARISADKAIININNNVNEIQSFVTLAQAALLYKSYDKNIKADKLFYLANSLPFMKGKDFYQRREFQFLAMGDGSKIKQLVEQLKNIREAYSKIPEFKVQTSKIEELIRFLEQNYIKRIRKNPSLPAAIINSIKHAEKLKKEAKEDIAKGNNLIAFITLVQAADIYKRIKMEGDFINTMKDAMIIAPITWEAKSPKPLSDDITTLFWRKMDATQNINRYNLFIEQLIHVVKKMYEWQYRLQALKVEEFIKKLNREVAPYIDKSQTPGTKGPSATQIYPAGAQNLRHMPTSTGRRSRIIKKNPRR
jgi:hypothetical protein